MAEVAEDAGRWPSRSRMPNVRSQLWSPLPRAAASPSPDGVRREPRKPRTRRTPFLGLESGRQPPRTGDRRRVPAVCPTARNLLSSDSRSAPYTQGASAAGPGWQSFAMRRRSIRTRPGSRHAWRRRHVSATAMGSAGPRGIQSKSTIEARQPLGCTARRWTRTPRWRLDG